MRQLWLKAAVCPPCNYGFLVQICQESVTSDARHRPEIEHLPEMTLRLESVFGRSAEDWLRRQAAWDLDRARNEVRSKLAALTRFAPPDRRLGADHVVECLRKHQNELKAAGLKHLFLFGSVARNEAGADSDVDLYFEKNRDAVLGLIEIGKLQERIEEILGVKTDLVPFDGLRKSVKETAQLESVRVF